jgi:hypothetical protein
MFVKDGKFRGTDAFAYIATPEEIVSSPGIEILQMFVNATVRPDVSQKDILRQMSCDFNILSNHKGWK